ncbi:MAG: Hsp33 family molecular chaperone HslO, partial [Myxococcales bacterium]
MPDQLVRLHLREPDLLVVGLLCSETARRARDMHRCLPTSAGVFAQGLAAGLGVAGVLAGRARINLQLACDGPVKGMFIDADAEGKVRGYVHNPQVNFLSDEPRFDTAGALGRNGMLSVLRELKAGEYYRGSVSMDHAELARDLERYYLESEQIDTLVQLEVRRDGDEQLGRVAGLFVQAMPDAQPGTMKDVRTRLQGALWRLLEAGRPARAFDVVRPVLDLFPGQEPEIMAEYPLGYFCSCSKERSVRAVIAMGRAEIEDLLRTEGRAVATCAFCESVYEVTGEELQKILAGVDPLAAT